MRKGLAKKIAEYIVKSTKHRVEVVKLFFEWLSTKSELKDGVNKIDSVKTIKPFMIRKWHNGTSVAIANTVNNQKLFIKKSNNKKAIKAEVNAINQLKRDIDTASFRICELLFSKAKKRYGYVIEEYIQGKPLSDKQFVATLTKKEKKEIIKKLLKAVDYFRSHNFIHGDLTPKNILITENKSIYIIDFEYSAIKKDGAKPEVITTNKKRLMALGGQYSMKNGILDDGYSLLLVAKYLIPDIINVDYKLWRELNKRIGIIQFDTIKGRFLD